MERKYINDPLVKVRAACHGTICHCVLCLCAALALCLRCTYLGCNTESVLSHDVFAAFFLRKPPLCQCLFVCGAVPTRVCRFVCCSAPSSVIIVPCALLCPHALVLSSLIVPLSVLYTRCRCPSPLYRCAPFVPLWGSRGRCMTP